MPFHNMHNGNDKLFQALVTGSTDIRYVWYRKMEAE